MSEYKPGFGDNGTTGLFSGGRVAKTHPRIEAVGKLDEVLAELNILLNIRDHTAVMFWLIAMGVLCAIAPMSLLFTMPFVLMSSRNENLAYEAFKENILKIMTLVHQTQAIVASPGKNNFNMDPRILKDLEIGIDHMNSRLPTLKNFILAHSTPRAAQIDKVRTSIRSAERAIVAIGLIGDSVDPTVPAFMNRLSLYMWTLGREVNRNNGSEILVSADDYFLASKAEEETEVSDEEAEGPDEIEEIEELDELDETADETADETVEGMDVVEEPLIEPPVEHENIMFYTP